MSPLLLSEGRTPPPDSAISPTPIYQVVGPLPDIAVQTPSEPGKNYEWGRMAFHVLSIAFAGLLCLLITDPIWRGYLLAGALVIAAAYELIFKRFLSVFSSAWMRIAVPVGVVTAMSALGLCFPDTQTRLCLLFSTIVVVGGFELIRTKLASILTTMMRTHEAATRTASTDFVIAMALCFLCYRPEILAPAVFITALADPAARLMGMRFGKRRWPGSKKTYIGSGACFLVAAGVAFLWNPYNLATSLVVGLVTVFAELLGQKTWQTRLGLIISPADNLYVPLAAGFIFTLLAHSAPQL